MDVNNTESIGVMPASLLLRMDCNNSEKIGVMTASLLSKIDFNNFEKWCIGSIPIIKNRFQQFRKYTVYVGV